jgi:hypothetical protein
MESYVIDQKLGRKELRCKMLCANGLICLVNIQIINRISPMFIKKYTRLVFAFQARIKVYIQSAAFTAR